MINMNVRFTLSATALSALLVLAGCSNSENGNTTPISDVVLKNQSATPALAKMMPGETGEVFSLIGSDDKLAQSPNFIFGGSADGSGLQKNSDGTFTMLVNHEDNFSVSRITFDKTFAPVKGEYVLNSDGGTWRLCSATLATPAVHGFGPLYLSSGESGEESQTHGIVPNVDAASAGTSKALAGLGRWSAENAVPLPKTAYAGKTAIIIGDDDSGANGGQVALYLSNTVGDLDNGSLYMLKRNDDNQREMDMKVGTKFPVSFVKIDNHKALKGSEINALVNTLKAIKFGRVEDVDYRKGTDAAAGREVYFNVTGQNNTGTNADYSRSKYGRVYRLVMDATDPLKGNLELILDGDDRTGPAKAFQNVDNVCVTENYVYVQEDPNSGYNDQTHDAYIYQYSIAANTIKPIIVLDPRRAEADADKYNVAAAISGYPTPIAGKAGYGAWEYGAMIDVSETIGIPNTFMISLQPHTWIGTKYLGPDGGKLRATLSTTDLSNQQASQIILVKGLPK
jgi:hypothetical protein